MENKDKFEELKDASLEAFTLLLKHEGWTPTIDRLGKALIKSGLNDNSEMIIRGLHLNFLANKKD